MQVDGLFFTLGSFAVVAASLWYIFVFSKRKILLNPSAYFVVCQMVMFWGSVPLLDPYSKIDQDHFVQMAITQTLFILTSVLCFMTGPVDPQSWFARPLTINLPQNKRNILYGILIVSVALTAVYLTTSGGNVLVQALAAKSNSVGDFNATEARRSYAYGNENALRQGYIMQLRDYVTPLLTALLFVYGKLKKNRKITLLAYVTIPIAALGALGTGQRGGFVDAVLIISVFMMATLPHALSKKIMLGIGVLGLIFFSLASLALGRHSLNSQEGSGLTEGLQRFTSINQFSSVEAFRYIETHPYGEGTVIGGVLSLLPSFILEKPKTNLSNLVFDELYGTEQGTAPGSLWTNVRWDYGALGTYLFAVLLAYFFYWTYKKMLSGPRTLTRTLSYSGVAVVLGTWIDGGPEGLINRGILTMILLCLLLKSKEKSPVVTKPDVRILPNLPERFRA